MGSLVVYTFYKKKKDHGTLVVYASDCKVKEKWEALRFMLMNRK